MSGVYYKYFDSNKNIIEEITLSETENQDQLKLLEKKILDLELKNNKLNNEIANRKSETNKILKEKKEEQEIISKKIDNQKKVVVGSDLKKSIEKKEKNSQKKIIKNLVKDVEYISVDQKGNKFYLLANSGKSNIDNNDILDLINVRGKITSDLRDTIYIVSDFAQYNSINLNSKFYENVIINYQDKQINCINFDINMDTNKAVAYNNVIITDPKSVMKAGIVEFDLKTKDININPSEINKEIKVITN
jgi:hypothetical protein